MIRRPRMLACLALPFAAACHDSGGGGATLPGAQDLAGPSIVVDFPPGTALTGATSIRVRGRATDASGVAQLSIAGVSGTLDPATGRFEVEVPLTDGDNHLGVEAIDARGNASLLPAAVRVRRETPLLGAPSAMAVDAAGGRLVVLDPVFPGVIAIDLATRQRSVLSEPAAGPALVDPSALVLAGGELWIASGAELQRVDPASGVRARVAQGSTGPGPARIDALAFDPAAERVFALDGSAPARVFAFERATGARVLLTGAGAGAGTELVAPTDLVFDAPRGRLLALDARRVVAIDPANGSRSEVTGAGPALVLPSACVLAPAAGRLYVADPGAQGLFAIDLATGGRELVANADPRRPAIDPDSTSLAWDGAAGRLLVSKWNGVAAVDPAVASAAAFALDVVGVGRPFTAPGDLAFDAARDQLLVHDAKAEGSRLVRVFVRTGSRRTGSSVTAANFFTAAGATIDRANDRLLALGPSSVLPGQRMLAYRLADGRRTEVASVPLVEPARGVCLLAGGDSAVIFSASELVRFDLGSHAAGPIGTQGGLGELRSVVAHAGALLVAAQDPAAPALARLARVDHESGAVDVLAAADDWRLAVLAQDLDAERVLALDELGGALVAIDTVTGGRAVLASDTLPPAPRGQPSLHAPRGLAFDAVRRVTYSSHAGRLRGIVATDVETGERVLLSR